MQWKDSGTYNDWISWVQGYRPSIVKDWWKGRKRKGSSEIIDGTDSDGGPPSVVGTDPSETESPKRTKPNEPGDIDDELFDIGSSVKCNFTTHRDPGHLSSDSPTPLLTPPPPASHGLEVRLDVERKSERSDSKIIMPPSHTIYNLSLVASLLVRNRSGPLA